MRRRLLAIVASAVLLPAAAAGSAAADDPSVQAIGQQAASQQSASSSATSTQVAPSNTNISVRIGSPGDGGAVTQTNSSSAASAAGNANSALQQAEQAAAGAGVQLADQSAANQQSADSAATSTQDHPKNTNIAVRIMSPGDDGDVTQTNSSSAASAAGNANKTDQSAGQSGGGAQKVGQQASSDQDASSEATSEQKRPSNVNVPVRIFSSGDDGDVTQTNSSSAKSAAGNANATKQASAQHAGGGPGQTTVQAIGQKASNDQSADSSATSEQAGASNVNVPVRIFSSGDDGDVTQTNSSSATSAAGNANRTSQDAAQDAGPSEPMVVEDDPVTVQAVGQWAGNEQSAGSSADSTQKDASNRNAPARIDSRGDDGDVTQRNASSAKSAAGNANVTDQATEQSADAWFGVLVQAIGQRAANDQDAWSDATSRQFAPSNVNTAGDGGSVDQANTSSAASAAGNENVACQTATQGQGKGPSCEQRWMKERARRVQ